jgi:integrase
MVSVNDASTAEDIREREWRRFENRDLPDKDRGAIDRFIKHRRVHGGNNGSSYEISSETTDLNKLGLASARASKALLDMDIDDLNEFIEDMLTTPKSEGGYGIGNGIDSYTRALRVFYQWLHQHGKEDAYPFWEQISANPNDIDRPDPSDRNFPDRDDYEAMMAEARGDPRAQAILTFYWESAVRRTLGAQLRLQDIDLSTEGRATFTPNPNGERQKGVGVKPYPLYEGVDKLRVWVNNHHPDPENEEAPLFTVKKRFYDSRDPDDGALSANRIAEILKTLAEKAGVEGETKVHAFRHAAITRWKERGYSLAQIQRRTAWKDSAAAEMWGKYGNPDDEKVDREIDKIEGEDPPEGGDIDEPTKPPEKYSCGNCGLSGITADHCGSCGAPVSPEAKQRHMEKQQLKEQAKAEKKTAENLDEYRALDRLEEVVRENPELVDVFESMAEDTG